MGDNNSVLVSGVDDLCPFMSTTTLVIEKAPGVIDGLGQATGRPVTMYAKCLKNQCAVWNHKLSCCSFKNATYGSAESLRDLLSTVQVIGEAISARLGSISAQLSNLEPPKDGQSPMMRLAAAVEDLASRSKKS